MSLIGNATKEDTTVLICIATFGVILFVQMISIKFYENVARVGLNTERTNKLLEELLNQIKEK